MIGLNGACQHNCRHAYDRCYGCCVIHRSKQAEERTFTLARCNIVINSPPQNYDILNPKWSSKVKILLAIVISSFIFLSPAYFCYRNLADINLSANDLSFEVPDQDNFLTDQQKEPESSIPNVLSALFLSQINPFRVFIDSSCQAFLPQQKPFVLRC